MDGGAEGLRAMSPSRVAQPRVRLNAPLDILATVPFLVGYHPTGSIVIVGMTGRQVIFAARDDLPPDGDPDPDQVTDLVEVLIRQRCDRALLVGYGTDERVTPTTLALIGALRDAGVTVDEALRADDSHYWSYVCRNPRCCSPRGTQYDTAASEVTAVWTLAGKVARRDRDEYESQIRPVTGVAREAMRRATARAHERLLELVAAGEDEDETAAVLLNAGNLAVAEALDRQLRGTPPDDDEVAWLSVLLQSIPIRDIAWSLIRGCGPALEHHRALWQEVLHRAETDLVPAPASLFAFAAWRCGDGGIARLALERALDIDPGYRMAAMLRDALAMGVSPTALDGFPAAAGAVPGPAAGRP
jgi:hypothetical protein